MFKPRIKWIAHRSQKYAGWYTESYNTDNINIACAVLWCRKRNELPFIRRKRLAPGNRFVGEFDRKLNK